MELISYQFYLLCLFLFHFVQDNERKEAGLKKVAAELKEREELDDQIEDLRAEIKSVWNDKFS